MTFEITQVVDFLRLLHDEADKLSSAIERDAKADSIPAEDRAVVHRLGVVARDFATSISHELKKLPPRST